MYEYRHVILPKAMVRSLPKAADKKPRIMTEQEWRGIGVQQSRGWVHYAVHRPEPHILLFRRSLGTDPGTGRVVADLARAAKAKYVTEYESTTLA